MATKMKLVNRETKEESIVDYVVDRDECNRADTTLEGLAKLAPVRGEGNFITAGNASQLSDGAAAVVLMEAAEAERRGLKPMGAFKGWAVAGCEPDEMGIGPVFAVPRLLERHGLTVDDIDLWELNEAFASQCLYSRDRLGIDPEKYNVNGGSIAIGHPFGMTGARCAGHILQEGQRRGRQVGRRDDVHRWRPGRRRPVRDLLLAPAASAPVSAGPPQALVRGADHGGPTAGPSASRRRQETTMPGSHECSCFIAPPDLLARLAREGTEEQKDAALRTLSASASLRTQRSILSRLVRETDVSVAQLANLSRRRSSTTSSTTTTIRAGCSCRARRCGPSGDPPSKDTAVNDAYDGAASTYDFYKKILSRDTVDGKGLTLVSSVHYGAGFDNAFWNGGQMVYGDGSGQLFQRRRPDQGPRRHRPRTDPRRHPVHRRARVQQAVRAP